MVKPDTGERQTFMTYLGGKKIASPYPIVITFLCFLLKGEFVFALSSDDNSEFWLSTDDAPLNVKLLAWVGKVLNTGYFSQIANLIFENHF